MYKGSVIKRKALDLNENAIFFMEKMDVMDEVDETNEIDRKQCGSIR